MTDPFGNHGWKLDGNEKLDCMNKVFSVLRHESKKVQFFFFVKDTYTNYYTAYGTCGTYITCC